MSSSAQQTIQSSSADESTFLSIDLNDLTNPHQMSSYFASLPRYRRCFTDRSDDTNPIDTKLCGAIAQFVYTNQIDGQFFLDSFTESDMKEMLSILSPSNPAAGEWIWKMLEGTIHLSKSSKLKSSKNSSLEWVNWINSSWTKHQIVATTKSEYTPFDIQSQLQSHGAAHPQSHSPSHHQFHRRPHHSKRRSSLMLSPLQSKTNLITNPKDHSAEYESTPSPSDIK